MIVKNVIKEIERNSFKKFEDDFKVTEFFDEIGDKISSQNLSNEEKEELIKVLINFIKNQPEDLQENFSFIHLIEYFDIRVYNELIVNFSKNHPSINSLLLLNRIINSQEKSEKIININVLRLISEDKLNSDLIKKRAKEYYQYQISKND